MTTNNDLTNEVIKLRQEVSSLGQQQESLFSQSERSTDTQHWICIRNKRRCPVSVGNRFKPFEILDDEVNNCETITEHGQNQNQKRCENTCTATTFAEQLFEYRSQQKEKYNNQDVPSKRKQSGNVFRETAKAAYVIGDSLVKNIHAGKLSRAYGNSAESESFRGAKIEDIQEKASELLSLKKMNNQTRLVIHAGSNNLAIEQEDIAVRKLGTLIDKLKPKVKSLAFSSVITRDDIAADKIESFNALAKTLCARRDVMFIDNKSVTGRHLNRSRIHLNGEGDMILGGNSCRYLRDPSLPAKQNNAPAVTPPYFRGQYKNHRPATKGYRQDTSWNNYLKLVRRVTNK